jgi:hypothetical protein
LSRQVKSSIPDLAENEVRNLILEPNDDNTLLLYDNVGLGLQFVYPRRWHVASVQGRRVALDEPKGSGLLLSVEPAPSLPTAAAFLGESRDYLEKQKARILRVENPSRLQAAPSELDHFGMAVDMAGQQVWMDYFVVRQKDAGATVAARLLPNELAPLKRDIERIAKSVRITAAPDK